MEISVYLVSSIPCSSQPPHSAAPFWVWSDRRVGRRGKSWSPRDLGRMRHIAHRPEAVKEDLFWGKVPSCVKKLWRFTYLSCCCAQIIQTGPGVERALELDWPADAGHHLVLAKEGDRVNFFNVGHKIVVWKRQCRIKWVKFLSVLWFMIWITFSYLDLGILLVGNLSRGTERWGPECKPRMAPETDWSPPRTSSAGSLNRKLGWLLYHISLPIGKETQFHTFFLVSEFQLFIMTRRWIFRWIR